MSDMPLFAPLGDSPTTWTVHPTDPSANFTTIQVAINNASNGHSIEVWNGTYNENVVVNKQLKIYSRDGANVTSVNAGGSENAITIRADGCTVDGFKVTGGGNDSIDAGIKVESNGNSKNVNTGINLLTSSNNTISKNEIGDNPYGIRLSGSLNNNISNNACYENNLIGIFLVISSNIIPIMLSQSIRTTSGIPRQ